ncbi:MULTISPECIES: FadR/GntR family transcriptional regulator [Bacillus]|uniref:FadR/GntR family transcriptional regulator n=1 Tax=Bacillus TaxID=1386 RepID=UPI000314ED2D|nr:MULTISPECIES: FadR/GntR family transcriptional regulator [Bacillus]
MGIEYKKIKKRKLYEEVSEALHNMIKSGELKPGDKLDSVQQLAENFQVGRSAIREALSALRAMGLVEMRQGEGTYIKQFDVDDLDFSISPAILMNHNDVIHLLEVRKIIEIGVVGVAARNRSEVDIEYLQSILNEMKEVFEKEEEQERLDILFHLGIARATRNPMLYKLMENVSAMMEVNMKETRKIWLYSQERKVEQIYQDHLAILDAIVQKNDKLAELTMWNHITVVEKNLALYNENKK